MPDILTASIIVIGLLLFAWVVGTLVIMWMMARGAIRQMKMTRTKSPRTDIYGDPR